MYDQYRDQVKKEATRIVKEQTSEKFIEITNKLYDYRQIVDSWSSEIDWNIDNPFKK